MAATESGTYRVYERPRAADERLLVERSGGEPIAVRTDGYEGQLGDTVEDLESGNLVDATLEWTAEGPARFADLAVRTRTVFAFADGTPDIFEQATETFQQARQHHQPIASNVTYGTDGDANGVVYTVAKQRDETDVFAELRDGRMTLEPLIDKLGDGDAVPPYAVFVLEPASEPFVVVYLVLDPEGTLANTIREEYDCRRR